MNAEADDNAEGVVGLNRFLLKVDGEAEAIRLSAVIFASSLEISLTLSDETPDCQP